VPGAVVFPALEGTRPVLVEMQALTVRLASGATPRRAVVGWDSGRLAMILAVLEARCGLSFSTAEVYLNVAGGYRVSDPAADLAVAAALVSALSERPVPAESVAFGEVALSGELRPSPTARCGSRKAPNSASSARWCRPRWLPTSRRSGSPASGRWGSSWGICSANRHSCPPQAVRFERSREALAR
jgi:hypothetical protein